MKKLISVILALAAAAALTSCSAGGAAGGIKAGVLAPLTGDLSIYGITTKNGIELAAQEINAAGGLLGEALSLEIMDEKGDIAEACNAFNAMVSKNISFLIGDVTSKPSMAVAELAADPSLNMPMMCPTGTTPAITTYGENVFRACFSDPFQGRIMATFASERLGAKKVAIIYNTSDDYSSGIAAAFEETAKGLGMEIVAKEGYGADDKDFKTQLAKIASVNPDALMVPEYYAKVALIAQQAREVGYQNPMLGSDGWDGVLGVLSAEQQSAVNNCYFSNHYFAKDPDPVVANFVKAYTAKYNEEPSAFSALGYDSLYMMKNAVEKAGGTDSAAVIEALKGTEYNGVTGHITFDQNGDPIKSVAVLKIFDGEVSLDTKLSA